VHASVFRYYIVKLFFRFWTGCRTTLSRWRSEWCK